MSRNPEYQFVSTDVEGLVSKMTAAYEMITGATVRPASPENLFILWVADVMLQFAANINFAANQNVPSRAEGENLDALGDLTRVPERPDAVPAVSTQRFYISAVQNSAVLVPFETRVRSSTGNLIWETAIDRFIPAGDLYADIPIRCQTPGTVGNGYAIGQINTLIDINNIPYQSRTENITVSDMGADRATDDEYYELMRESMGAFSTAGARAAYIYHAKKVSTEISDVVPNSLLPGHVNLFTLMKDGTPAGAEIKSAVESACNAENVRAFTDLVSADDPETVSYDIDLTYFIPRNQQTSAADIETAVLGAVDRYIMWQGGKFGRDINPDILRAEIINAGAKRIVLTGPIFTPIRDGLDNTVPQIAAVGTVNLVNGGFEDE